MRIIRFVDEGGAVRQGIASVKGLSLGVVERESGIWDVSDQEFRVMRLLSPVVPTAIICIGLNYREHAGETGMAAPERPVVFMKNPAAVIGPGDAIVLPASCRNPLQVDYEVELAVVIGRPAKNVPEAEALSYVRGYTVGNDVSARIWQKKGGGGQWVRGKSFDTFCPLGPELVTPDEIPDPGSLNLTCVLNGETMQAGNTSQMIFSVNALISYLSEDTTLLPGTVIMTGTPSGVGYARIPPVYLKPGDRLSLSIDRIGTLENTVV
jgi:2-keto-4-pentenoate hydratase/2-oxohepta-3-ene-1,7-dioic acid hydratase in catechol pathway